MKVMKFAKALSDFSSNVNCGNVACENCPLQGVCNDLIRLQHSVNTERIVKEDK